MLRGVKVGSNMLKLLLQASFELFKFIQGYEAVGIALRFRDE